LPPATALALAVSITPLSAPQPDSKDTVVTAAKSSAINFFLMLFLPSFPRALYSLLFFPERREIIALCNRFFNTC